MKEVYASLSQVLVMFLTVAFILAVFYITKVPREIFLITLAFLLVLLILVILSYKGKIPLYRIKE